MGEGDTAGARDDVDRLPEDAESRVGTGPGAIARDLEHQRLGSCPPRTCRAHTRV